MKNAIATIITVVLFMACAVLFPIVLLQEIGRWSVEKLSETWNA